MEAITGEIQPGVQWEPYHDACACYAGGDSGIPRDVEGACREGRYFPSRHCYSPLHDGYDGERDIVSLDIPSWSNI